MQKKREVVLDTSALLSLQSGSLLRQVTEYYNLLVIQSVMCELEDFAQHDDELGSIAQEILDNEGLLDVETVRVTEEIPKIEHTDNEVYNLALEEELLLIIDDVKFCRKVEEVETAFSTYFLGYLVERDKLTAEEAMEKLASIQERRNWRENIIYLTTRKELEKLLE